MTQRNKKILNIALIGTYLILSNNGYNIRSQSFIMLGAALVFDTVCKGFSNADISRVDTDVWDCLSVFSAGLIVTGLMYLIFDLMAGSNEVLNTVAKAFNDAGINGGRELGSAIIRYGEEAAFLCGTFSSCFACVRSGYILKGHREKEHAEGTTGSSES